MHRQQIDEGRRRIDAVGAARTRSDRAERLRQPQQAEIADVHLLARDRQAVAVDDAAGADMLGGVDDDVDACRRSARPARSPIRVSVTSSGTISTRSMPAQAVQARETASTASAMPTKTIDAPASEKALAIAWPTARAAVGDQDAAEFRIAGHLAQLRIIGHVRRVLVRQRDRDRRAALVELELEPHAAALDRIAMKMRDDDRAGIELHGADAPGRALAEIGVGRCLHASSPRSACRRDRTSPERDARRQAASGRRRAADRSPSR